MDDLKKSLNNISLYDVKAYVRKAQNVVYNYTEMESKVREATNNEPWGASSTLMQKIAAGTYNYREREEIIGMIFRRFTEKAANEWRQIYKSLQLLEYLIKNGSERFVDDARANLSLIQMLRSFHYIDSQGRDQGINVRTKSKTLVELLNNDVQLRAERKKSRDNAKKFQGVSGGAGAASSIRGTQDFDDDYGTYEGRIFGDGGVYGQRFEETRPTSAKQEFEEYDVDNGSSSDARKSSRIVSGSSKPVPAKPAQKQPEVDLFSFDEPVQSSSSATNGHSDNVNSAETSNGNDEFDEFGDFQSSVQPSTTATTQSSNLNSINLNNLYHSQSSAVQSSQADTSFGDFTSFVSSAPTTTNQNQTYQSNSFFGNGQNSFQQSQQQQQPNYSSFTSQTTSQPPKQDAFSSLFQTATSHAHVTKSTPKPSYTTPSQPSTYSTPTTTNTTTTTSQVQSQPVSSSNNDEINLLDL